MVKNILFIFLSVLAGFNSMCQAKTFLQNSSFVLPSDFIIKDTIQKNTIKSKDTTIKQPGNSSADEDLFDQLAKLPAFIRSKKRIDSLRKATNIDYQLHVDYTEKPYMDNNTTDKFSMTILYEREPGKEMKKLFTIWFDKDKRMITSVTSTTGSTQPQLLKIDWSSLYKQLN
jgi:hypothetical protein